MQSVNSFVTKFASSIVSVLSCFDRVIFKGHLPFPDEGQLNSFVDFKLKMRRMDFIPWLQKQSERLVAHAREVAEQAGRPYRYLEGPHRKEQIIQEIIRRDRLSTGLVAVLCCQETCRAVKWRQGQGRPHLIYSRRPQRVLYYYWLDPQFGLRYVRLQTWFPYTVQVYVNGHDWLAQQMLSQKHGFVQRDNAFTQLDRPEAAQSLADGFVQLPWRKLLDGWAGQVNPLLNEPWLRDASYYWVSEQAEYSTDVLFASRQQLAPLYERLLDHAAIHFSAQDILTFLGRRLHPRFEGEVLTDCKKDRWPGARIKHRMKNNWLKMYDKFGQILRIETVINDPREFRVRRRKTRQGRQGVIWCPMNKGISNLYQYRRVALAANERYLDALSVVDNPACAYKRIAQFVHSKRVGERSFAGFNPACAEHVRLFQAVLVGTYALHGFRNSDIRRSIHGDSTDPILRRRQAHAIGRQLKRLHVRGYLAKIPRTQRWRATHLGHQILGTTVRLYHHGLAHAA